MRLRGIVLSSMDYKESSKIVYLYTEQGKISVRANGANRPNNGLLGFTTAGNIVSFITTDSDFPSLSEYQIEHSGWISTKSLGLLEAIMIALRVIGALPNDINHKRTYAFIENILININEENYKKALAILLIKLSYPFGVAPSLRACTLCGSEINLNGFRVSTGGAICRGCGGNNPKLLAIWHQYYYDRRKIEEYDDFNANILFKSIEEYYEAHMHIRLKLSLIKN